MTGLPPVQVLLYQVPLDDFFAHSKGTPTEVVINRSKNKYTVCEVMGVSSGM
jgi:hypothetical protein